MKQILLGKYILDWKIRSETGFIFELSHFYKTGEGGSMQTPIGVILGFPVSNPRHWKVKVILRSEAYYVSNENGILIIVESAYRDKRQYALDYQRLKETKHLPIDPNFKDEFIKYLITDKICSEPLFLEIGLESIEEYEQFGELTLDDFD